MNVPVRYITDEQGEYTAVVLDLGEYERLTQQNRADPDILTSLSQPELWALASCAIAPQQQSRLSDLQARNAIDGLSPGETVELDTLLEMIDCLTLLKTRARYTLATYLPR